MFAADANPGCCQETCYQPQTKVLNGALADDFHRGTRTAPTMAA